MQKIDEEKKEPTPIALDLISVIIPTHNREELLNKAIGSVATQDINCRIEFVIVDDNSQDGTKQNVIDPLIRLINQDAIIKKKFKLVYLFVKDGPHGPSHSRNLGILHSTGNYIYFLDSDDTLYDADSLNHLYTDIKKRGEDCLVYGNSLMYTNMGSELWEPKHLFTFPAFSLNKLAYSDGLIPMGSFMLSSNLVKNEVTFKEEMGLGEDFEWQLRMAMKYPFYHTEKIVHKYYRGSGGQLTTTTHSPEKRKHDFAIINETKEAVKELPDIRRKVQSLLGFLPNLPITLSSDILSINMLSSRSKLPYESVAINCYLDGEYYSHSMPSNILWILSEPKLNRKFIESLNKFSLIFTYNCALTEKLISLVTAKVFTLAPPYGYFLEPPIRQLDKIDKKAIILLSSNDDDEEELILNKIPFIIFNKEMHPTEIQTYPLTYINSRRYFNLLEFFMFSSLEVPVVTTADKGCGLIPNNGVVVIEGQSKITDTILKLLPDSERLVSLGRNSKHWSQYNPENLFDHFINKFSSIIGDFYGIK